jgi:predicted anti-sigma-YlaC factor YlaD
MNCEDIRQSLHEAYDEQPAGALSVPVRSHLVSCDACRQFDEELRSLSRAFDEAPQIPFPADALDVVWSRTIRSSRASSWIAASYLRLAAAVVVTGVSMATLYYVFAPPAAGPSAVELARASAQAELVLGYTARALAATRDATTDRVLASKVSPAVRGVTAPRSPRRPQ